MGIVTAIIYKFARGLKMLNEAKNNIIFDIVKTDNEDVLICWHICIVILDYIGIHVCVYDYASNSSTTSHCGILITKMASGEIDLQPHKY